jgi:hypothetical protein
MTYTHLTSVEASGNWTSACLLAGIIASLGLLAGCGTTSTVVVAKDGDGNTIVQAALFKDCPGTTFQVTVTPQGGQPVTSEGTVAGGTLKFSGLKDINTGGVMTVSITAISGPGCEPAFKLHQTYTTGPIALTPARGPGGPIKDTFIVDVDKFH